MDGDFRRDDLEGDDPVHHLVMGLVHPAHRPRADPVQDDVAADQETVRLVVEKPSGLVECEHLVVDQPLRQGDRIEGVFAPQDFALDLGELSIAEDARAANHRNQVGRKLLRGFRPFKGRHRKPLLAGRRVFVPYAIPTIFAPFSPSIAPTVDSGDWRDQPYHIETGPSIPCILPR